MYSKINYKYIPIGFSTYNELPTSIDLRQHLRRTGHSQPNKTETYADPTHLTNFEYFSQKLNNPIIFSTTYNELPTSIGLRQHLRITGHSQPDKTETCPDPTHPG